MGMPEFITVQCDETGSWIGREGGLTENVEEAALYVNHHEALIGAKDHGWFVTADDTLSPQGWEKRYETTS